MKRAWYFSIIAIFLISFVSAGFFLPKITGDVIQDSTIFPDTKRCKDSDGGVFFSIPGKSSYVPLYGIKRTASDKCISSKILAEYYCNSYGRLKSMWVTCDGNCNNGACSSSGNGSLRVRVYDDKTKNLLNDAYVYVYTKENEFVDSRSTRRGFAYFATMPHGDYKLVVTSPRHSNKSMNVNVLFRSERKVSVYLVKKNSPKFIFVGNQPRSSYINADDYTKRADELEKIIKDLGADGYDFVFPPRDFNLDSTHGDEFFEKFVENNLEISNGETVYTGPEVGISLTGFNLAPTYPYRKDYLGWFSHIDSYVGSVNNLLDEKNFTVRVILDDFFAYSSDGSFADIEYMKKLCSIKMDKKRYNVNTRILSDGSLTSDSTFKLYSVIYCGNSIGLDSLKVKEFSTATTHEKAFADMLNSDDELKECFDGVYLYTSPRELVDEKMINNCIKTLRPLKKEIIEGVYISDLAKRSISYNQRYKNINISRKTAPDGFAFFVLPINDSLHIQYKNDNPRDLGNLYNYLKELLEKKENYIQVK